MVREAALSVLLLSPATFQDRRRSAKIRDDHTTTVLDEFALASPGAVALTTPAHPLPGPPRDRMNLRLFSTERSVIRNDVRCGAEHGRSTGQYRAAFVRGREQHIAIGCERFKSAQKGVVNGCNKAVMSSLQYQTLLYGDLGHVPRSGPANLNATRERSRRFRTAHD